MYPKDGVAWGNRTPVFRRHLERVMTVTLSQHATYIGGEDRNRTN